jgi:hypothetical protein
MGSDFPIRRTGAYCLWSEFLQAERDGYQPRTEPLSRYLGAAGWNLYGSAFPVVEVRLKRKAANGR